MPSSDGADGDADVDVAHDDGDGDGTCYCAGSCCSPAPNVAGVADAAAAGAARRAG